MDEVFDDVNAFKVWVVLISHTAKNIIIALLTFIITYLLHSTSRFEAVL